VVSFDPEPGVTPVERLFKLSGCCGVGVSGTL